MFNSFRRLIAEVFQNKESTMFCHAIMALAVLGTLATTARAELIITFEQVGNNVVATGSGSINLAGLTGPISYEIYPTTYGYVEPASGNLFNNSGEDAVYSGLTGPTSFGPGTPTLASSVSGDSIGIFGLDQFLELPKGYVSGSSLSNIETWDNNSISNLGLTSGTYIWNFGSGVNADYFELVIPGEAVPEPSSIMLVSLMIGAVGFGSWVKSLRSPQVIEGVIEGDIPECHEVSAQTLSREQLATT
jgi:hypothetical protein